MKQARRLNNRRPQRRLDAAPRQSRQRLKIEAETIVDTHFDLYNVAPVGFYTLDRAGRITELNDKGAKLLAFSTDWLLGKSFVVFIARQDVQRFLTMLRESRSSTEPKEIQADLIVDNRPQPVQMSLTTTGEGASLRHRITVVDLTDFRKTEHLLEESLTNWHSLVYNAPDIIMTVENDGRIAFANRPIWGYSVNALVGSNLLDYIPETQHRKVLRCLELSFRRNKRTTCEISGLAGDWDRWFNLSFGSPHPSVLPMRSGLKIATTTTTTTTTTVLLREVSESKRAEDALRTSGEQMRDFAARLEAVREEERARVAREIHDELGQALTALKLDLSWILSKAQANGEIRKKMKAMVAHVDETIESVRRISSELRPPILDDLGLIPAIEWQVNQFRKRTGIRIEFVSNAEGVHLPTASAAAAFRVVQEALTNIMRHAHASRVRIGLDVMRHALKISIADNGRGMSRQVENDIKSLGIVGMKERIARLSGDFTLFSAPGKGTRLDITIPTNHD